MSEGSGGGGGEGVLQPNTSTAKRPGSEKLHYWLPVVNWEVSRNARHERVKVIVRNYLAKSSESTDIDGVLMVTEGSHPAQYLRCGHKP